MSKRTVIVSGGILEKEFVLPILQSEETEFIIGVDKGLQFLYENEIKPDYIVGDFDSVPREIVEYYRTEENVPIREFNPVKDASDTEIALRLCLGLRRKEIYILGGTGNRIDHLWANIQWDHADESGSFWKIFFRISTGTSCRRFQYQRSKIPVAESSAFCRGQSVCE